MKIQYFSDLLSFRTSRFRVDKKSDSKFVKFDKWNDLITDTVSCGCGISKIPLHYLQAVPALINHGL